MYTWEVLCFVMFAIWGLGKWNKANRAEVAAATKEKELAIERRHKEILEALVNICDQVEAMKVSVDFLPVDERHRDQIDRIRCAVGPYDRAFLDHNS